MGQCVSRKAGAVIAASGYSPSYRIMEKKSKNQADSKNSSKRGTLQTRGTAISFGFRRRAAATTGIPVPITTDPHHRSKSVGPEHESRRRQQNDDDYYQANSRYQQYSSSGRSTPRLAPPKKESSGLPIRTNRFGFRSQTRYTDKVTDLAYSSHQPISHHHLNQDKFEDYQQDAATLRLARQSRSPAQQPKPRPSPVNQPTYNNNNNNNNSMDGNRRTGSETVATVGKYTLHTSHLPLPQYAVRVTDATSKIAKTAANQSRKVGAPGRAGGCSSKEGSGTEDSGLGSQHGGYSDDCGGRSRFDFYSRQQYQQQYQQPPNKPRKLNVMVSGKSFDVRDVDDEHTVTEISVIQLPNNFAQQQLQRATPSTLNTGLVRERTAQYQRAILSKDNRYTDSTTSMSTTASMSTTSSEGYDEGLGEEKAYKDRSRSEKLLAASSTSSMMRSTGDFSRTPSSDEQEFGHGGEAMADEYSISSNDDYKHQEDVLPQMPCNTVTQTTHQHFKAISNAAKNGTLPNSTLRSVLLTIEDPAFAAVAATTTTLIDDETSPVDSLFDSPTASVSQGEAKKKEFNLMERSGNTIDDDSPGTPTNASLSLSEGREYFDDEIADQPGLVFDETLKDISGTNTHTDHSQTVLETQPKTNVAPSGRSVENSPMHGRKIHRAGSVSTLSSCESLASDDLMMDYERSDASSFGDVNSRGNSTFVMQDLDDATSLLDLEIQGQEVMKDWNSLLGQTQQALSNSANNNVNNVNNNQNAESGLTNNRSRLLHNRSNADSPRSIGSTRSSQVFSPLRTPRNTQSPSLDSGDEGSLRIERGTYSYMFQDIVSIKTMLLKLKRVLQESGENGLTRTDTLNPFDNTLKNGLFYNLNDSNTTTDGSLNETRDSIVDELSDLRRQVVFLQGQVDEKDRTILSLQEQLAKYQNGESTNAASASFNGKDDTKEMTNAATQTDKLRPLSTTGTSLLQGLSQDNGSGSLVSLNDLWISEQQRPTALALGAQQQQQQQQTYQQQPQQPSPVTSNASSPSCSRSTSRRSSEQRPSRLRQPSSPQQTSESPRSSIPTPRSRLATPTLIPRAARAVSATGRAHNS